jgi:hypothetical protein
MRESAAQVAELLAIARPRPATRRYRAPAGLAAAAIVGALLAFSVRPQPATHTRTSGATRVQDVCCFNLDGGPQRDDGMLTVSRAGQVVDCVVLYEDRAGKRAFSPHDPLRFISQPDGCTPDLITLALTATPEAPTSAARRD